jgi:serine/threonine protein kinase
MTLARRPAPEHPTSPQAEVRRLGARHSGEIRTRSGKFIGRLGAVKASGRRPWADLTHTGRASRLASQTMADLHTLISRPDADCSGPSEFAPASRSSSMSPRMSTVEVGFQYGRYRVEHCLGVGGMSAVYRAFDAVLARPVAVKTALAPYGSSDVTEGLRFLREAEVIAQLKHPNVVNIYDLCMHEQTPYIVLEFLEGSHLGCLLDARKYLEPDAARNLMLPVLSAIAYAHRRGILHLDLKPSNIFVTHDHRGQAVPKVLDFGVCQLTGIESDLDPTQGRFAGTPAYASPEALAGQPLSALSDQFSLGVLCYEALSGVHPFGHARTLNQVLSSMRERRYPRLATLVSSVPESLSSAVHRAMEPDPIERFPDVETFARALLVSSPEPQRVLWLAEFEALFQVH